MGIENKKVSSLAEIKSSILPSLKPYSADIGSLSLSILEATDYEKGNPFAEMYGAVYYSVITNGEYFAIIRNINTPDKGLLPVLIEDTYFPHRTNKTIDEFKTCFGEHELASVNLRIDDNGKEDIVLSLDGYKISESNRRHYNRSLKAGISLGQNLYSFEDILNLGEDKLIDIINDTYQHFAKVDYDFTDCIKKTINLPDYNTFFIPIFKGYDLVGYCSFSSDNFEKEIYWNNTFVNKDVRLNAGNMNISKAVICHFILLFQKMYPNALLNLGYSFFTYKKDFSKELLVSKGLGMLD